MLEVKEEGKNKRLVVVDGENCYTKTLHEWLLDRRGVDIIVVVNKQQQIKRELEKGVKVLRAKNGYKNAIDFVIVALVTDKLANKKYSKVEIISDDKGFRSAVNYLNSQGYKVSLVGHSKELASKHIRDKDEETFRGLCGFISNNTHSGITENKIKNKVKDKLNIDFDEYRVYMEKLGYIERRKKKIYFENLELSCLAKNKLRIGERLI